MSSGNLLKQECGARHAFLPMEYATDEAGLVYSNMGNQFLQLTRHRSTPAMNFRSFIPRLAAALLFATASLYADDNWVKYQPPPDGGKIKIDGTSTIHDWTVECGLVPGTLELDAAFDADFNSLK